MKNLTEVQNAYNSGKKLKYVFFWKPTPFANGELSKSCFGQWWMSPFVVGEITYGCAEQYIMAEKARLFDDNEMLEEILNTSDPKKMKALGQKVHNFNQEIWEERRFEIVKVGNYAKFSSGEGMKAFCWEREVEF